MYAPTDNVPPSRSVLMRFLVKPRKYRHYDFWVRVRNGLASGALGPLLRSRLRLGCRWE